MSVLLTAAAAAVSLLIGCSIPAAANTVVALSPSASSVAPSPADPTHSYDDPHTKRQPVGSSQALWILAGALVLLAIVATVLIRAGAAPREHLPGTSDSDRRSPGQPPNNR